ncbi:disulfide bond formation protein B [Caulobacter sp. HMWF009]|nr:disulfide bond formation protein B [Caulobacter sp. HMWF009]PTT12339.1 disulfide bond formation protein B [Caulobacter sp. HMWF025]
MTSEPEGPVAVPLGTAATETTPASEVRATLLVEAEVQTPLATGLTLLPTALPVVAFLASAAMLGTAHAFETFGKMAPCNLCLKQREVYWVALTVAGLAIVAGRTPWAQKLRQPFNLLLAAIFLFGAGLAAFHAGVEWKWWPGPTSCVGGSAAVTGDLVAMLKGGAIKAPSCDKAAWVFLGLSMAGWNALASLGLAGISLLAGLRKPLQAQT